MELKSKTELKRYVPTDIANCRILFLIGIIINILSDKLGLGKSNGANQLNSICERDILDELDESGYTWVQRMENTTGFSPSFQSSSWERRSLNHGFDAL